jgi:glycine hydroxymethyltransferase
MSAKTPRQYYDEVLEALQEHNRAFNRFIPLIASENITSPAVREALTSDLATGTQRVTRAVNTSTA